MKKAGLNRNFTQLFLMVLMGLGQTSCVSRLTSGTYWKSFDGISIVLVSLFLVFFTLATMRTSKYKD